MSTTGSTHQRSFSHSILLVLVMSSLLCCVHWFGYTALEVSLRNSAKNVFDCVYYALWILLPVVGWVAESWLGRYRAIMVGLLMTTVPLLMAQVTVTVILEDSGDSILAILLTMLVLVFGILGIGSWYTNILPFSLDQMIGASAEELSAVVQWYCWSMNTAMLASKLLKCVPFPSQPPFQDILPLVLLTFCFSAVLVMDCVCHKRLDIHDETGNPIKLIFQVLNYA